MAQAPDKSGFINTLTTKYPAEWAKCNAPNDDGSFCRKVVEELQAAFGKRWGLNAKRDGNTLSKDVVDYYIGPTDRHVEVIDFIVGHEAPNARIGWNDVTDYANMGNPGTARYVDLDGSGYDEVVNPIPNPQPQPDKIPVTEAINRIQSKVGHTLSQAELLKYGQRAMQLGWDGTSMIAVSIVDTILAEIVVPKVEVPCTVSGTNSLFPVGTKITLTVG